MRLVVHDFIGHPFQVQLSRQLARNGNEVLHLPFPGFETPKGPLEPRADDPAGFGVEGITLPFRHSKYNFALRGAQEWVYSRKCVRRIRAFAPDVVISANATPNIQGALLRACRRHDIGFVPWVQDFHGVAIGRMLRLKLGALVGAAAGRYFERLDRAVLQASDRVILISPAFLQMARLWPGVAEKSHVIENWAPLPDLPVLPKRNGWSEAHDLADRKVLLYAGTLGLKHNPQWLAALAQHFAGDSAVRVVVISQGPGADWLRRWREHSGVSNLVVLDYQPFAVLPEVLAAADVLIAILEDAAGDFSVPSKVLAYCCAERPLLVRVPEGNMAGVRIREARGGIVLHSNDAAEFVSAAEKLLYDAPYAAECSRKARLFAETQFNIATIANRFEAVLRSACETC
jgi:glycosyltransferase involved in cell wall biosynthesis